MTLKLRQHWRMQANAFDVERKSTGEVVNGEETYYYEKSFQFPGGPKQILIEDRHAHSTSRPFCPDPFCPCHWHDQDTILSLTHLVKQGVVTDNEAKAIFHGDLPFLFRREPANE